MLLSIVNNMAKDSHEFVHDKCKYEMVEDWNIKE